MGHPDKNDGIVLKSNLDGSDIKRLYRSGKIHTPKQVVIDRINRKLYVCDHESLRVHRSNFDGSGKENLVQRGNWKNPNQRDNQNIQCVGICVDPTRGKFYWTRKGPSKGGSGQMYRANTEMPIGRTAEDRTDIELLFNELPEPLDLAINTNSRLLYWTDQGDFPKGNSLNRADVSGEYNTVGDCQYSVRARQLHEAVGLRVDKFSKHIYVTDLGGCVHRYHMNDKNVLKLFEGQGVYTSIALAYLSDQRA